ncbi:MAG: hypothetical protein K9J30_06495 [Bacteroidales bacterium]|nr:hypothetical protein [Bacteroidales bacterium]
MRTIYHIAILILFLGATAFIPQDTSTDVMECAEKAGPSAIYLKDFRVELPAAKSGEPPPMFRQAIVLRGNNIYRFNLCNSKGEAVIRIYDSSKLILSSYDPATKKESNPISFLCRKTGPYNIVITFKDGKEGEAIGIMSHVKINESRRSR